MAQSPGWYVRSTRSADAYFWDGEKFTGQSQEVFAGEPYSIFPEDELLELTSHKQLTPPEEAVLATREEPTKSPLKGPVIALLAGFGVFAVIVASLAIIPKIVNPPLKEPIAHSTLKSTTIPVPGDYDEERYKAVDKDAQFIEDFKQSYPKWNELAGWNEERLIVIAKRVCADTRDGVPLANQKLTSDLIKDDIPEFAPFTKAATISGVKVYCPAYTQEAEAAFAAN
jgi:hypothetical protein